MKKLLLLNYLLPFLSFLLIGEIANAQVPIQHLSSIRSYESVITDESGKVIKWTDLSGNNNHATPRSGDVIFPSSSISSGKQIGLDFGNARNYLRLFNGIKTDAWLDFSGEAIDNTGFSILVAFSVAEIVDGNNDLVGNNSSIEKNGFGIRYKSNGEFEIYLGKVSMIVPGAKVKEGESIVVACNYNKLTEELVFWDSKNLLTHTLSIPPSDFTLAEFNIGSANNYARYFIGNVGEVKVYDEALTSETFKYEYSKLRDYWCGIPLPIEVVGAQGTIETRSFDLSQEQVATAKQLWLQINNLSYENKVSVKINNGSWYNLNHESVIMQSQEKARGGMQHGGFNTIRLSIPTQNLSVGENTFYFKFNHSDAISNGFRVIDFNLLDENKARLLEEDFFTKVAPIDWVGPYTDEQSIAEGETLWREGNLWSNYLEEGQKGFWYGYELQAHQPLSAKCADCHTQDGRDLELFSYSNKSIIERAKFHNLSENEGRKIASYIRSLSGTHDNINRHGRPWNPPYQPGPSLKGKSIDYWAAGAGLDAVLDHDSDMLEYMFPNGVNESSVKDYFDADKFEDRTVLPLAIQFPDWKHWLPMVHPKDAFNKDNFYNQTYDEVKNAEFIKEGGEKITRNPDAAYEILRDHLLSLPKLGDGISINLSAMSDEAIDELKYYHETFRWNYRYFQAQGATDLDPNANVDHWRTKVGKGLNALSDDIGQELAATSLARLMAVKNFEFMQEFNLQDKAPDHILAEDNPNPRQWFHGDSKHVFEVPAHMTGCVDGDCLTFDGQPNATGEYESSVWYHLQSILAGGEGEQWWNGPVDYNYQPEFILLSSHSSGIYDVLRYYHSLASLYQIKTWSGDLNPNDGYGFRIRVQGPWYFFGKEPDAQRSQFKGFSPGYWPSLLDEVYPGLGKWVIEALLTEFLEAVKKHDLSTWKRWDGINNTDASQYLDPIAKSEVIDITLNDGDPIFSELDPSAPLYADHMYWSIQQAIKFGVDCSIVQEMIDWSTEAWPNIDWSFDLTPHLQLQLPNNAKFFNEINVVKAVVSSEGVSPEYIWEVNGNAVSYYGKELPKNFLHAGDSIVCHFTSNASCLTSFSVSDTIVIPNDITILSKINEGEWQPINNTLACIGDEITYKLELEIDPILWLDAYQISNSTLEDGAEVRTWENKATGLQNASILNESAIPVYSSHAFRGKPAVVFGKDKVSSGLKLIEASETDFLEEDWTIFVVHTIDNVDNWSNTIGNKNGLTEDGFFYRVSKTGQEALSGGFTTLNSGPNLFPMSKVSVLSKKGLQLQSYNNGQLEHDFEINADDRLSNQNALMLGQISVGKNQARYHDGLISEVIIFDRKLNDSQRELVEAYLSYKWELDGTLSLQNGYHRNSPLDVTITTPIQDVLPLNQFINEQKYVIIDNNSFGNLVVNYNSSDTDGTTYQIKKNGNELDNIISYSLNNNSDYYATAVDVFGGDQITLSANVNLKDNYFWRSPNGQEQPMNTSLSWQAIDNDSWDGQWELVIQNSCGAGETIIPFDLNVYTSESELFQYGKVTFNQLEPDTWTQVNFTNPLVQTPVVTLGPLSFNGSDPSTYRIRNCTENGFEIQIREWDYLNRIHNKEVLYFLAVVPALNSFGNLKIDKGELTVNDSWQTYNFEGSFINPPVVLTNVVSDNENKTKVIQIRNVTPIGFDYKLIGQESTIEAITAEQMHFIAIEKGESAIGDNYIDAGYIENTVNSTWSTFNFPTKVTEAGLFGNAQTTNDVEPYSLRYKELTNENVQFFLQEEKSLDSEILHASEDIGWVRFKESNTSTSAERVVQKNEEIVASLNEVEEDFKLYPVPVISELNIVSEKIITSYQIFDVVGTTIDSNQNFKKSSTLKIDMMNMKSGVYIIMVGFINGDQAVKKFFKQ
ncbi:LamG-like jellyroll fold domain-containing protein [Flammeovirga kamogawensis]|uniref:T9SS type A sorting domain-containing protein n=1 Tax=Flammeovirga kamogawensis TaxID=373891 RepID=A0ABX8H3G3_9BACT|nr:polysaccharide lyase family protein [Flammeovirga kamogawensis]MBB6460443.1 hypothetical protein [Flammeovirga kamogawensis]QWG10248.1 hypothetical protein KM029_21435 [Flammeovirga kamogawensis]TRX64697.1 hypothetical protein EO216_19360 [Flammeovirga kamogawensis]